MPTQTVEPTTGVKGEIRASLHIAIRKWTLDNATTMQTVITEALEEWAQKREIETLYPPIHQRRK